MDPNSLRLLMGSSGAAGAPVQQNYIEDVFSTWLYTGTGATQTITNNLDLSTKGGLTWIKGRSGATGHRLTDTVRGATKSLESSSTAAELTETTGLTAFGTTGFTIGVDLDYNLNGATYTSWSFCKQAKFFDVVTYTGNGANRTIAHNLGSVPGCIIIKRLTGIVDWAVYHRSLANTECLVLNNQNTKLASTSFWNSTTATSSVFSLGTNAAVNFSGAPYVAYIFAHNAGGFGPAGTDDVISCGSFTTDAGGNATVTLGWEPQFVIIKESTASASYGWIILDTLRGWNLTTSDKPVYAERANAESTFSGGNPTATGFVAPTLVATSTYVYIAIRRGPMKTPTDATKVFGLSARTGTGVNATVTGGQLDDAVLIKNRGSAVGALLTARLAGNNYMQTSSTAAETTSTTVLQDPPWDLMDGVKVGTTSTITNASSNTFINYLFRRAAGFFDVVAGATINSSNQRYSHNLGVAPELIIQKSRDDTNAWVVYEASQGISKYGQLAANSAFATASNFWGSSAPTSTDFGFNSSLLYITVGTKVINYLFATLAGVSKVGSYTGTGTTNQINCGFTNGARFVLIKRTDSTGDWYVWDTARGIVAGNDPFLLLNSTAAENTATDYIDPLSTGFEISSTAPAAINANGGNFIYLAIA